MRKKPDPAIVPLQSAMFAAGLPIGAVCKRAGVNPTTWSRWASGGIPDTAKLRAIAAAIEEMASEEQPAS